MHKKVKNALEGQAEAYTVHRHSDYVMTIRSPRDFAEAIGYSVERIAKSLFLCSCERPHTYAIVVLSANHSINFTVIAEHLECKRMQIASREELNVQLGYPPTGVSPIGVEAIPIFLDESLVNYQTIIVGSGEIGTEIEISPTVLLDLTSGRVANLTSLK
jgi:Cys-tRNA(Pro)/Cys-tRNA(Cys) deacylase